MIHCKHLRLSDANKLTYVLTYLLTYQPSFSTDRLQAHSAPWQLIQLNVCLS